MGGDYTNGRFVRFGTQALAYGDRRLLYITDDYIHEHAHISLTQICPIEEVSTRLQRK